VPGFFSGNLGPAFAADANETAASPEPLVAELPQASAILSEMTQPLLQSLATPEALRSRPQAAPASFRRATGGDPLLHKFTRITGERGASAAEPTEETGMGGVCGGSGSLHDSLFDVTPPAGPGRSDAPAASQPTKPLQALQPLEELPAQKREKPRFDWE
jgi:hypothetical protein